jgi:hypothetical protein
MKYGRKVFGQDSRKIVCRYVELELTSIGETLEREREREGDLTSSFLLHFVYL